MQKGQALQFNERAKFIEEFIAERVHPVMKAKGAEYSRGEEDSNSNFKRVAEAVGSDPVTVCYVYLAKHLDSIASYVQTREVKSDEPIEGRIGDAINYLLILASLLEEEQPRKQIATYVKSRGVGKPIRKGEGFYIPREPGAEVGQEAEDEYPKAAASFQDSSSQG